VILALVEGAVLFSAVTGAILLWGQYTLLDARSLLLLAWQAALPSVCCIVSFYYNDLYDLRIVRSFAEFSSRLLQSFGVALILLAAVYTIAPTMRISNGPLLSSLLIIVGLLVPLRAAGYSIMRRHTLSDRVLILGTGDLASTLIREIDARPHYRYAIVGVADDGPADADVELRLGHPLRGPLAHLDKIIEEVKPDRIVVALAERRGRMPMRQLLDAESRGILVEDGLQTYEHFTGKLAIEALTPSFLIFSGAFRKSRLVIAFRRVSSLVIAAAGLVLTAPIMLVIALAIRLESRGPVFFMDERAGLAGRPFLLIKFRTMLDQSVADSERSQSVWQRDDSARITRVGRWVRRLRLDELPQFWNILRGDMDLVGPRPEILRNVKTMSEQIPYYSLRLVVRPGLTGWAQVRHGYSVSLEQVTEKMRHDLFYIKHMSNWLDLRILVDTVKIVLFGRGAR
jgi:exopolysaccharide biosynthesis polyprenyl glycosylphosphotransferase